MRKINLLLVLTLFTPIFLFSQVVINPDYVLTGTITSETLKRNTNTGAYRAKGGFDINKNGKKEIIILTDVTVPIDPATNLSYYYGETNSIFWLEEDGNGNYELLWSYSDFATPTSSWTDFTVGDVDNNGYEEIWVALPTIYSDEMPNPPRLFVFAYDGTKMPDEPTLTWNLDVPDNFTMYISSILIDDINGDGEKDIIITTRRDDNGGAGSGRTLMVANYFLTLGPGAPDFGFSITYSNSNICRGGYLFDSKVVDFDGDGVKEVWAFTWDFYTANIFLPTSGSESLEHVNQIYQVTYPDDIGSREGTCFYDMDGDGKLEGYMAGTEDSYDGTSPSSIWFFESVDNVRNLTPNHFTKLGFGEGKSFVGTCIGDFNNNGLGEFVVIDAYSGKVFSMEYKGSGNLNNPNSYTFTEIIDLPINPDLSNNSGASSSRGYWFVTPMQNADGSWSLIVPNHGAGALNDPCVYIIQHKSTISVEKKAELPEAYNLAQNYPNPFNPSTNIEFSVPKSTHVSLKVYNVLGQEVSALVNEIKEAGNYIATFNANNLPSGIYWYTIKAGNYTASKKMMLIK
jgi:hypothetical protein